MKRRDYMTRTGAIAAGALAAGCLGLGDGGGSGTDLEDITIVMAPGKFPDIAMHQINTETNILADEMESAGYSASVEKTFSGGTLFASDQAQISAIGPLEAVDMATERDFNLVHNAFVAPNYQGWYVNSDSSYTVDAAGSVQAAIDSIVDENATVVHGSWGDGRVASDKFVHEYAFGYTFAEEGGDFNVATLDHSAIPQALAEDRFAVGASFGTRAAPQLMNGDIENLYHYQEILSENDLGENTLNCWTTKEGFTNDHPEAIAALVRAWQQGVDRVFDNPIEIATSNDAYLETLEVNNEEQARWAAEWAMTDQHGYTHGQLYENAAVTDEMVSANETLLNNGVELGIVPEDWSDHLSFREVPTE